MGGVLPSGVVTFVMTDIEGSTRLWDIEPTTMAEAVREHSELVARSVGAHGGTVVKERGEGDSTFSVFARASDATRAAHELQLAVSGHPWPTSVPLRIRVAIHTGEATEGDGDYVGSAVNRSARLRAVARPGEIVLSQATASIVGDHLPHGVELRSLGELRLRGLSRDEHAFVLVGAGLPELGIVARGDATVVLLDERGVTRRERDVLDAVADRLTNAEIASRLSVSERTVESHVSSLLRKLGVTNRLELADLARRLSSQHQSTIIPPMLAMAAQRSRCVGRGPERLRLLDCWRRTEDGGTSITLVTGEAGIGKSRLVSDLALAAHRRGGLVLYGASTDGARAPYQAFVDALADPVATSPELRLREDLGRSADALALVLPEVRSRLGLAGTSSPIPEDTPAIHAAICAYLTRLSRRQPVLLVLEDLHWASQSTREVVLQVARGAGTSALLVVGTTRDVAPDLDETLARWLAAMRRLPVVTTLHLAGLDTGATAALLDDLGADVDPAAACRATGGNPFLLRELAGGGAAGLALADFVASRRGRLLDHDLEVLDTASVLGESFATDLLARATGRSIDEVLEVLGRARDAGLVEPLTPSGSRFVFVHAMVRDACYETVSTGRRLHLHAAAATALSPREDDPAVLPELARHAAIAAPLGGADLAVERSRRAGEQALVVGDMSEAIAHFERALDIVDLTSEPRATRLQLSIRLGESVAVSDPPRALELLREATRLARRLGDAEAFADAVCSMTLMGGSLSPGRRDDAFVALAEEALERLPEHSSVWRARTMALLGSHLALSDENDRGRRLTRAAVELARRSGDVETFARSTLSLDYSLNEYQIDEAWSTRLEGFEAAMEAGLVSLAHVAAGGLAWKARTSGDLEASRRWYERAASMVEAQSVYTALWLAVDAFLSGHLDDAESLARAAASSLPRELRFLYSGTVRLVIDLHRGITRGDEETPLHELDTFLGACLRAVRAVNLLMQGEADLAASLLNDERRRGFERQSAFLTISGPFAVWAEVAAAVGDRDAARELDRLLEPLAGTLADHGPVPWSTVDHARALAAGTIGDADRAVSVASEAVDTSRERGTPIFLGRELLALAWARRAAGGTGPDLSDPVDEALDLAARTGAQIIELDAARLGVDVHAT